MKNYLFFRKLIRIIGYTFLLIRRIRRKLLTVILRPLFKNSGSNFIFDPDGNYSFHTIEVGDDGLSDTEQKIVLTIETGLKPSVSLCIK